MTTPVLAPLLCPSCNAPVAVADGHAKCAHCGVTVEVPEEHRKALRLVEAEVAADALTQRAFQVLGPPPAWQRGFARLSVRALLVGFCLFINLLELSMSWGLDLVSDHWHVNLADWLTRAEWNLFNLGFVVTVPTVVFGLVALGRRTAVKQQSLVAALAAKAPTREGGPSSCRVCGAPLHVGANALGVRCVYCRADNLVALPTDWVAAARHRTAAVVHEARAALAERRRVNARAGVEFMIAAALWAALWATLGSYTAKEAARGATDSSTDLRLALREPPRLIGRESDSRVETPADLPLDDCEARRALDQRDFRCDQSHCELGWLVALRAGDTLVIDTSLLPSLIEHRGEHAWVSKDRDFWGREVPAAETGSPTKFIAPTTAWYRVELDAALELPTDLSLAACVHRLESRLDR